jgi:alpha-ketoglutarate-dependent taurine dioxygenase
MKDDNSAFGADSAANFGERFAWTVDDLTPADWQFDVPDAAMAEMAAVAGQIEGRSVESLGPDNFDWPHTRNLMGRVRQTLREGVGFALLGRLPVDDWGIDATRSISWLLMGMLGSVVEQKYNGARIYDVRDMKKPLGHGVRRSITNLEQEFHTDGGWLPATPEFIGLACLHQAAQGGMSRVSSLATAHRVLEEESPDLIAQLYRPLWWDRQAEHAEGDTPCRREPVFYRAGQTVEARYYDDYVRKGYRLMDEPLDTATIEALDAFRGAVERPEHCFDFFLEPGQIELVNNRAIAHARTKFEDAGDADRGRHLVRLWVRSEGGTALEAPLVPRAA